MAAMRSERICADDRRTRWTIYGPMRSNAQNCVIPETAINSTAIGDVKFVARHACAPMHRVGAQGLILPALID